MSDFFNSVFGWLGDLLTDLWRLIKKALPYIMLAIALFLAFSTNGLVIPALGLLIPSGWLSAAVAMGVAFLLAPKETANMINPGVDAIGDVVGNVVTETAQVVGEGINAISNASGLSNVLLWIGLGLGAYFLLTSDGKKEDETRQIGSLSTSERTRQGFQNGGAEDGIWNGSSALANMESSI